MENLADLHEDVPVCSDEQVEDRRADYGIQLRVYDLEQASVDEEKRRVSIAVSNDAPAFLKRSRRKI